MPPGGDRATCSSFASGDATPEETLRVGLHRAPSIRLDIPHLELESLHPSSFIPHPASYIPTSCVPASCNPASCIPTFRVPASHTAAPVARRSRRGTRSSRARVTAGNSLESRACSSPGTPRTAGRGPPSPPAAPPRAPHCSPPPLPGGGRGCSFLKGPSPLLVAPAGREHQWGGACPRPPPLPGVRQPLLQSSDPCAPPPSLRDLRPLGAGQERGQRCRGEGSPYSGAVGRGGTKSPRSEARGLGRRAERAGSCRPGPKPPG